ncbi:MAG: hypothetical protein WB581_09420 [Halobacteriota archaeon]
MAGCTSSTSSTTNQTPSATPSTSTHNAILEAYINAVHQNLLNESNLTIKTWDVTWNNDTSVHLSDFYVPTNSPDKNATMASNTTLLLFPSTQAATNFFNAFDKSNYSPTTLQTQTDQSLYKNVTGHAASVYTYYYTPEPSVTGNTETFRGITQLDNLIEFGDTTLTT